MGVKKDLIYILNNLKNYNFVASRISTGNKLFPVEIKINDLSITIIRPSILGGNETTIPYTKIASVQVNFPFVGFSTITIFTVGEEEVKAHGFLKAEAQEIKNILLSKISI